MSGYLVEVKRSARKSNAAVGSVVCQRGASHRFASRDEAESWAADLTDDDAHVWIRAANPDDRSDVDAYLVGWLHRGKPPLDGTLDSTEAAGRPDGREREHEQAWLADYERVAAESTGDETATRYGGERITDWLASQ
ncbi:hypothetical protein C2R22_03900 [Salinigranum rubrum]|uniref:DUF8081 domain-containing protein n=1 Tax=Salinigranum rubrum TaxID=755307 RepID=A0A2I8VG52_9EURY|nr:hypothetical protein [Salinigranum rubrum]AUV80905.1 hypothetical protein C2R22_03900 [Salinigranum rubrum]